MKPVSCARRSPRTTSPPQRAEPLYDLARFYRERGMNNVGLLYAEAGLALDRPGRDAGFVEDFVYTTGLREEYSIAAFSPDPLRKERGHVAADWLTLSRAATPAARQLARSNVDFYCEPASALMPSFSARPVGSRRRTGGRRPTPRSRAAASSWSWCSAASITR